MKNIDYKKLKKYEIGKMSSLGYEDGLLLPEYQSDVKVGDNLSSDVSYYKQQLAPQLVSRASSLVSSASPLIQLLIQSSAKNAAATGAKTAGSSFNVGMALTGAMNTLLNGFLAFGDTKEAKLKIDPTIITSTANKYTDTKFGLQYDAYGAVNRDAIMSYMKARNRLNKTNMITSYASTFGSAGSMLGAINPALGLVGWGLGSGIGAVTGLAINDKYEQQISDKVRKDIANANNAFMGYNTQSEAVAASKGLRQQYSYGLADNGKDRNQNLGYPGKIGIVHTAEGKKLGIQYGLGGGGELLVSKARGSASVINEGKKHVDNIPIGVPIDSPNPDREWDDLVVLGNTKDKATGKSIADEARPYARAVENNGDADAFDKLMYFADVQSNNLKNKNKDKDMYKADEGKPNWGELSSMILPRMMLFGIINAANRKFTPTATNPYVSANVQNQLNALYNLHHDPSQAIQNARDAGRQATYAISHSGYVNGGLKQMAKAFSNYTTLKSINDVISAYNDKDIEGRRAALGASIQAAESDATRRQQGNQYYADAMARAKALNYNQQQAYFKSLHDMAGSFGKDITSYWNNLYARGFKQLIIDAYNKDLIARNNQYDPYDLQNNKYTFMINPFFKKSK